MDDLPLVMEIGAVSEYGLKPLRFFNIKSSPVGVTTQISTGPDVSFVKIL